MSSSETVFLIDTGAGTVNTILLGHLCPDDYQFPADTEDKLALFAIFDGHGSALVAEHARKTLPKLLVNRPEFKAGDYETAIREAFFDEDKILLDKFLSDSIEPAVTGTTVALCFANLTKGVLVVGNLGDSHIVLAERDGSGNKPRNVQRLTKAHKPGQADEKARIKEAGGSTNTRTGTTRVGTLNMSRALGDLQYKNPVNTMDDDMTAKSKTAAVASPGDRGDFLSNEAHLARVNLSPDKRYVLVCSSDGVCDTTDEKALVTHIMKSSSNGERARDIAQNIVNSTAARIGSDNSTCIVVLMDGTKT
ncbi:protein phosphatase 2C, putative [Paecilomyces variotii No. 5]|uniref:protein-serine/threonine phosphatase n=1 Tax=Byssochlamys spectabilis (strain No. 5 / NBRC 109023) TaxID=1356009 RepID=V5FKZ2_BYSSN|nr:protein phosphatase 2C, putative [Paecilomyces variotii No. 5]